MEEVIFFVLQILFDLGVQLFGGAGLDTATSRRRKDEDNTGCGTLILFAVFGGVCGVLSILLFPKPLLPNVGLQVANLIVSPLIAGGMSYLSARGLGMVRESELPHHFWRGFWFALAFGVVRFAYVHR
ncbi:MAG: hypothetical protein C0467_08925 [Planctomycetaceae bacterium]|nr:hypothetical protein [Planctomycetaceae bacterium]